MDATENTHKKAYSMRWTHVLLIVSLTILITITGTYWILKTYFFTSAFTPVTLNVFYTCRKRLPKSRIDTKFTDKIDIFQVS